MKLINVLLAVSASFLSVTAFASGEIFSCDPQYIASEDLQPYKNANYFVLGTEVTGEKAEKLFASLDSRWGRVSKDRFGEVFFEERDEDIRIIPVNSDYELIESSYCRESSIDTRCVKICRVLSISEIHD